LPLLVLRTCWSYWDFFHRSWMCRSRSNYTKGSTTIRYILIGGLTNQYQQVTCVDNSAVKGEVSKFDLAYDYLVVSVGASNATFNIPGKPEWTIVVFTSTKLLPFFRISRCERICLLYEGGGRFPSNQVGITSLVDCDNWHYVPFFKGPYYGLCWDCNDTWTTRVWNKTLIELCRCWRRSKWCRVHRR